ncbi:phosphosulfolactate synthase [Thermodesulfobacteriota bacterium]
MTTKPEFAFSSIPIPRRDEKPREKGLTMMIDWGLPLQHQKDCLEGQGLYVDEAKIAGSIHRVMPLEYLKKKIQAYQKEGIFTFPGGLFTELAIAQGNYEVFLEEIRTTGFSGIEVSDNLIQIDPKKKKEVISKAVNEYGLTVMGEVGRKEGSMSGDELIADIENCLEAGSAMVLIEAHELFHGDIRQDVMESIAKRVPMERIMFELPVTVLPDVTKTFKTKVLFWMISQFGTNVNLANVEWDEIYFTEICRIGASGESTHPEGAFRLAGVETAG